MLNTIMSIICNFTLSWLNFDSFYRKRKIYNLLFGIFFLFELLRDLFLEKYLPPNISGIVTVAYENENFLGFSACKEDDELKNCLYLDSLHVSEASRGKGVGTKLINTVGNYAYIKGYEDMSICIVKGNDKAKRIYEKMGAKHYKDFIDYFGNTKSNSDKLIWDNLSE